MAEDKPRGAIYAPAAYAQGKMVDHSSWQRGDWVLPRKITPSDIDFTFLPDQSQFVLDNNGSLIYGELTRGFANWLNVRYGQRLLYENCIRHGPHCAVICQHNVPTTEQIDSRSDVLAFQVMVFDFKFVRTEVYTDNLRWQNFIKAWFVNLLRVRHYILGKYGMT